MVLLAVSQEYAVGLCPIFKPPGLRLSLNFDLLLNEIGSLNECLLCKIYFIFAYPNHVH